MAAYNRLHGTHCSANERLLTTILRDEWGWDGVVISDWFAVHSTVEPANAGLDLEMPGPRAALGSEAGGGHRRRRGQRGRDRGQARAVGAPGPPDRRRGGSARGRGGRRGTGDGRRSLARRRRPRSCCCATRGVLPLDASIGSVALLGPNADREVIQGGGSARVTPTDVATIADGLRERLGDRLVVEPGIDASRGTPAMQGADLRRRRRIGGGRRGDPRRRRRGAQRAPPTRLPDPVPRRPGRGRGGAGLVGAGDRVVHAARDRRRTASRSRRTARPPSPSTAPRSGDEVDARGGSAGRARARGAQRRPADAPVRRAPLRAAAGAPTRSSRRWPRPERPTWPSSPSGSTTTGRPRAATARRSISRAGRSSSSGPWRRSSPAPSWRWWPARRSTCRGPSSVPGLLWCWLPGPGGGPGHRRRALRRLGPRRPPALHHAGAARGHPRLPRHPARPRRAPLPGGRLRRAPLVRRREASSRRSRSASG